MADFYPALKHTHMLFVTISILGFMVRAYWSLSSSNKLQLRWVKILPHINDTLLLLSALGLALSLQLSPHNQPWLLSKILLLVLYIGLGVLALKPRFSLPVRAMASVSAILCFVLIAKVAMSKLTPLQILAGG